MTGSPTWQAVIGLEVHAQLRTQTKIFCGCAVRFGSPANTDVCPVCLGLPGALPVLNAAAVQMAVRTGLALGCTIQAVSVFSRKNYFYPDLPKGYQISQGDQPICLGGQLQIGRGDHAKSARIERIHLEEDAGKSLHGVGPGGQTGVDLNRAGTPLLEIVGKPDLSTPQEAAEYVEELRAILVHLGVCDGNLEQGSLRCDANVSVHRPGEPLGIRCEIKNMNSYRNIRDAVAYEIERQTEVLVHGGVIVQQTRLWNPDQGRTEPMRSKENANDYRYFPEPDLMPLRVQAAEIALARQALPELPSEIRQRLQGDYGLSEGVARWLVEEPQRVRGYERQLALGGAADLGASELPSMFANFLMSQVNAAWVRSQRPWADVDAALDTLWTLGQQWREGQLSNKMLAQVLTQAFTSLNSLGDSLKTAQAAAGAVVSDVQALREAVATVIGNFPKEVERYRGGQVQIAGFFVGQVMRVLGGKGDAKRIGMLVHEALTQ